MKRTFATLALASTLTLPAVAAIAPCAGGYVGLSFDDGPSWQTNAVLDALKLAKLKAVFFLIGYNVEAYPDVVKRIAAEGHQIGNHTAWHEDLTSLPDGDVTYEIQYNQDVIFQTASVTPKFVRPPYNATDTRVNNLISSMGLSQVLLTVDSWDWYPGVTAEYITQQVSFVEPGGIIDLHDDMPETLRAIPMIANYFNTQWAKAPICGGKLATTTNVVPVRNWPGYFFFVRTVAP